MDIVHLKSTDLASQYTPLLLKTYHLIDKWSEKEGGGYYPTGGITIFPNVEYKRNIIWPDLNQRQK